MQKPVINVLKSAFTTTGTIAEYLVDLYSLPSVCFLSGGFFMVVPWVLSVRALSVSRA